MPALDQSGCIMGSMRINEWNKRGLERARRVLDGGQSSISLRRNVWSLTVGRRPCYDRLPPRGEASDRFSDLSGPEYPGYYPTSLLEGVSDLLQPVIHAYAVTHDHFQGASHLRHPTVPDSTCPRSRWSGCARHCWQAAGAGPPKGVRTSPGKSVSMLAELLFGQGDVPWESHSHGRR